MNTRTTWPRRRTAIRTFCLLPSALCLLCCLSGCSLLAVIGAKTLPTPTIQPKYINFPGQTVAVMVWADAGLQIDYPSLQLDVGTAVQNRLQASVKAKKPPKELRGVTFPYPAASVVRYQEDHPEIEGLPIAEVAPKLGVSRVIYFEIERFQTRADAAVDLYRGSMAANVKVVEVKDGKSTIAFEELVTAVFPKKVPAEGMPGIGDAKIYAGLVGTFAQEVANRFVPYKEEE